MTTTKEKSEQQKKAIAFLRKALKPGKTVYTIVRKVSSSGMSRQISTFITQKNSTIDITWYVAHALDYRRDPNNGALKVNGCGMDMGFHVVYNLGRKLYPNGFKLAKKQHGRNGDKSGIDTDGGYALRQEWL